MKTHIDDLSGKLQLDESVLKVDSKSGRLLRYDLLSDVTGEGIWDFDIVNGRSYYNEGMKRLFGYSEQDMANNKLWWETNIHPEDRERVVGEMKTVLSEQLHSWYGEYLFRKNSGEYLPVMERLIVVRNENRIPIRLLGTMQDISLLRKLNTELEKERQETRRKIIYSFLASEEKEKKEISEQLHEDINQVLATIHLLQNQNKLSQSGYEGGQGQIKSLIQDMMSTISSIANKLSPLGADILGFDDLMSMTINKLFDSSPILTTLNIKEKGSNWTNHEKSFVYRIVFEQLKNVVKHSSAKHCNISVYKKNEEYHLEVSDDGIGIDLTQLKYGTGFSKIHYIIEALDGQYHIKTGAGMGFNLAVSFPVEKAIS